MANDQHDTPAPQQQQTHVWHADNVTRDADVIARAAELLRLGELVAFPTETVYGLGADATNAAAVAGIFAAKGRPFSDPLIVHIADAADVVRVARTVPPIAEQLIERFWPGPLTLVLPRANGISPLVAAGGDTIGVRMPAHPVARALIRVAGVPVAAPSANRFMHTSPTTAAHVLADLNGRIAAVLDGGPCAVGVESTVLDLTSDPPRLLRPGGIALEALHELLPEVALPVAAPDASTTAAQPARAPGQMERHYAPHARLIVFDGGGDTALAAMVAEIAAGIAAGEHVGALATDEEVTTLKAAGAQVVALGQSGNLDMIASQLYGALRTLDDTGVRRIVAHTFGATGLGLALNDRLQRAAGGHVTPLPTV